MKNMAMNTIDADRWYLICIFVGLTEIKKKNLIKNYFFKKNKRDRLVGRKF